MPTWRLSWSRAASLSGGSGPRAACPWASMGQEWPAVTRSKRKRVIKCGQLLAPERKYLQIFECGQCLCFPTNFGHTPKLPLPSGLGYRVFCATWYLDDSPVLGVPVTLAACFAEVDSFVLISTSLVGGQCCWLKVANTAARRPGQTQQQQSHGWVSHAWQHLPQSSPWSPCGG